MQRRLLLHPRRCLRAQASCSNNHRSHQSWPSQSAQENHHAWKREHQRQLQGIQPQWQPVPHDDRARGSYEEKFECPWGSGGVSFLLPHLSVSAEELLRQQWADEQWRFIKEVDRWWVSLPLAPVALTASAEVFKGIELAAQIRPKLDSGQESILAISKVPERRWDKGRTWGTQRLKRLQLESKQAERVYLTFGHILSWNRAWRWVWRGLWA